MAIGTSAAIIGSAVLGAGASALSASKQSGAARDATNAQVAASNQAAQIQNQQFQQTRSDFEPFRQMGLSGGNALMSLLGLQGGPQATTTPAPSSGSPNPLAAMGGSPAGGGADYNAYVAQNPDLQAEYQRVSAAGGFGVIPRSYDTNGNKRLDPGEYGAWHAGTFNDRPVPGTQPAPQVQTTPMQPAPAAQPQQGQNALATMASPTDQITQTPGYNFLVNETMDAVNANNASRGIRLSGANQKELTDRLSNGLLFPLYQDRKNDLLNLTNIGTGSAAQISNAGQNNANAQSNILANIGNAQATGAMNRASAFQNGLAGITNNIGQGVGMYGAYKGWF